MAPVKRIAAAKFKAHCLSILDRLEPEGVVITKHGRPVARVLPIEHDRAELIGALEGQIAIHGNLLTTGAEWDAGD